MYSGIDLESSPLQPVGQCDAVDRDTGSEYILSAGVANAENHRRDGRHHFGHPLRAVAADSRGAFGTRAPKEALPGGQKARVAA
jgi:hypothetical protein